MTADAFRDRWLSVVMRAPWLDCCPKITMIALYAAMLDDGTVTLRRAELADMLAIAERTVSRHLTVAVERGFLRRRQRGQKGRHAVYAAALPVLGQQDSQRADHGPADRLRKRGTDRRADGTFSAPTVGAPVYRDHGHASAATTDPQAGRRGRDDADPPPLLPTTRVATSATSRDHDDVTRGRGAGVPQGPDEWCRSCGGWLAVDRGEVVDGRCSGCTRRLAVAS